jgi:hypothetical protein
MSVQAWPPCSGCQRSQEEKDSTKVIAPNHRTFTLTLNASRPKSIAMMHEITQNTYAGETKRPGGTLPHVYFPGCFFSLPTYPQPFCICTIQEPIAFFTHRLSVGLGIGKRSTSFSTFTLFLWCRQEQGIGDEDGLEVSVFVLSLPVDSESILGGFDKRPPSQAHVVGKRGT